MSRAPERTTPTRAPEPGPVWSCGVAFLAVALALLGHRALSPFLGPTSSFLFLFGAVLGSVWCGGWRAGLLATVLGTALGHFLLVPPPFSFFKPDLGQNLPAFLFALEAGLVTLLARRLRDALRQSEESQQGGTDLDLREYNQMVTHTEIEDLKQAEEALRKSEGQLKAILSTAADAILTVDERGIIESANPATEQMFGFSAAEMIGQNVGILMPAPYQEEHDRYLASYLRTGVKRIIGTVREVKARRKDGTTFPVELAVSETGPPRIFTGILRDIGRRKELEREVLEIASLEQRRIGQELHDGVGQELTGLSLMAQALSQMPGTAPAEGKLAAKLVAGIGRVHQQVRSLSHGLVPVEIDPEGLRAALENLVARCREQSSITCTFSSTGPVHLTDPDTATHLFRITQEAITNAFRHAQARQIRIALGMESGTLTLSIQDDGVGIPDLLPEGRGLGLRLMRYRADLIGATLTIGPAAGGGTLVTCVLSRRDQHD